MDKDLQIELLTSNYVKLEEKLEKHQIQIKSLEEKIEELKNLLSKIPSEQSKLSDGTISKFKFIINYLIYNFVL